MPSVKHTYGSKRAYATSPSSPRSSSPEVSSFFANNASDEEEPLPPTKKRKINASGDLLSYLSGTLKPSAPSTKRSTLPKRAKPSGQLKQLHLALAKTAVKTCPLCDLSFVQGATEDERLHKKHCARVTRGLEWGREEDKASGVTVIEDGIRLQVKGKSERGRIIRFNADIGGRVGAKLTTVLETINFSLSAPALPASVMTSATKVYFFLLSTPNTTREKIVGCVVAQPIKHAMAVVHPSSDTPTDNLICVDEGHIRDASFKSTSSPSSRSSGALYASPTPLPTPLGISRLFTSAAHRGKGIAPRLLDATAKTFIHGCTLDPKEGQVAFSQPTSAGRAAMEKWGGGAVRVYEE